MLFAFVVFENLVLSLPDLLNLNYLPAPFIEIITVQE